MRFPKIALACAWCFQDSSDITYRGLGSSICCCKTCRIWTSWRYGLVRLAIVVGLVSNPMYFCASERAWLASSGFPKAEVDMLALEPVPELKELEEPEDGALLLRDMFDPAAAIGADTLLAGDGLGSGSATVTG